MTRPSSLLVLAVLSLFSLTSASHFRFSEWTWNVHAAATVNFTLNVGFRTSYFYSDTPALGTSFFVSTTAPHTSLPPSLPTSPSPPSPSPLSVCCGVVGYGGDGR